ncbi:MAG: four helix bundle protein [Candidatus Omnitrophota bacterium]|nr:four helix bundle protein [Candidatus Omnitrophota bacterium]
MAREFDLEKRTTEFAKAVIRFCKTLSRNPIHDRLIAQAVAASGSVGANYREANDPLGPKDFIQRMRIARREAKESYHWLELLLEASPEREREVRLLMKEAEELKKILSTIINKMH